MKTDLNEITATLSPDLGSVGLSEQEFNRIYAAFEQMVNGGMVTITGYCNHTFGRPTHIVTGITRCETGTYQARIAFLESHPETGHVAKALLSASLRGQVRWLFAITQDPLEIRSIEAVTEIDL